MNKISKLQTILCASVLSLVGCKSKSEPNATTKPAEASSAPARPELTQPVIQQRLSRAGFKIVPQDALDNHDAGEWPVVVMHLEKGQGEDAREVTVVAELLAEPGVKSSPPPVFLRGSNAMIRIGWTPEPGKQAPDLTTFANALSAMTTPDKAYDKLFFDPKFEQLWQSWKPAFVSESERNGGGISGTGADLKYTFLHDEAGSLSIEIISYGHQVATGDLRLVGSTLLHVESEDPALAKQAYDALAGA